MSRGPDSGPTLDPLSLCQHDINFTVTCFKAVFKTVLITVFYVLSFVTANICPSYGLTFEIK